MKLEHYAAYEHMLELFGVPSRHSPSSIIKKSCEWNIAPAIRLVLFPSGLFAFSVNGNESFHFPGDLERMTPSALNKLSWTGFSWVCADNFARTFCRASELAHYTKE